MRISAGAIQLLVGPASSCLALQMKVRSSTRATSLGLLLATSQKHAGGTMLGRHILLNALELIGKKIGDLKVVVSGAGASAIASAWGRPARSCQPSAITRSPRAMTQPTRGFGSVRPKPRSAAG